MPKQEDYYGALGVPRDAKDDDIRNSYRRLVRKHHPDVNPGDKAAEERFKKIQEAYDILSDKKKRGVYDQYGFYSDNIPKDGFPGGGAGDRNVRHDVNFHGFDFPGSGTAAGGSGFGGFRDIFSHIFRDHDGSEKDPSGPERGADLEYGLDISFWDSIRGSQVKLNVSRQENCGTCNGSGVHGNSSAVCSECDGGGQVQQMAGAMRFSLTCPRCKGSGRLRNVCPTCHGDGKLSSTDTVEVRIPAGASDGSRLRVPGKGNVGNMGGPAGDLYIRIHVQPHPLFTRNGSNIEIRIPITVSEAALGAKIEVPTIEGRAQLKIPQGTQNGQKFRMREKGVMDARKEQRGDQIVEVAIQALKANDERTREILRELSQLQPEDPRQDLWSKV
jgi:molecular chaperone DnaJ